MRLHVRDAPFDSIPLYSTHHVELSRALATKIASACNVELEGILRNHGYLDVPNP